MMRRSLKEKFKRAFVKVNAGSYHEGFVNYGDQDIMHVVDEYLVVDCIEDITEDIDENIGILIIDSQDCKPGYVRLLLHKEPIFKGCYCLYNGKKYFNGKMLIEIFFSDLSQENNKHGQPILIHGPAISVKKLFDITFCFPCKNDLKKTEQFQQQFPCHISNQNNLFYFVTKCHPYSQNPDIEFRWSFAIIQYNLICQFTEKEFQLHFLCKELYNTYIKSNDDENEKCLSSYTVKTIMLYLLETHEEKIKSKSIINLVKLFLCELKCRLQEKYLPHYFIRECNLFDVLEDEEAKKVLRSIENIEKDLFSAILNCRIFMTYESLVTLKSVYRISNEINDINMQEDILRNILKERSIQVFSPDVTIKDFFDYHTYEDRTTYFLLNVTLRNCFDVLCIYFYCHTIFEGKYSCSTITKFKNLLTRLLPLYLVGLASKKYRRSIIHLLIETLLLRSIYLPNPFPTFSYNAKIPLAFYYYLCNEEEKVFNVLTNNIWICYLDNNASTVMPVSGGGNNFPSIVSNDIILKELVTSESHPILSFSTRFIFFYIMFRMTKDMYFIETLEKHHYAEPQVKILNIFELRTIDILKKHFQNCKLIGQKNCTNSMIEV